MSDRSCSARRPAGRRARHRRPRAHGRSARNCSADRPGRCIDHVHEHARALEVGEELVPEACPGRGPFDQSGNVGDRRAAASIGASTVPRTGSRCERIVGDLRLRIRDPPQERGLAGVREPDESCVREQLQSSSSVRLLARQADLGEAGRPARGRREPPVAASARAAPRDHRPCPRCARSAITSPRHRRPACRRHPQHGVVAGRAVLPGPPPGVPVPPRASLHRKAERSRRSGSAASTTSPPVPAVAPVGSASGHVLLAAEAERAVASAPCPQ